MAISLARIQDLLLPGLEQAMGGSKSGLRIESYVEFETDNLVIKAGEPGNWLTMKLSRLEIEDDRYIDKLRAFVNLMCGSKGSIPMTQAQAAELAQYQRLVQDQPNLFKREFTPPPSPPVKITARELTKEELKERVERRLDLDEAKAVTAVDVLNHARWRQVMDEVFKEDDNKGDDHAKRTEAGSNGGRKRGNGTGGSDAG